MTSHIIGHEAPPVKNMDYTSQNNWQRRVQPSDKPYMGPRNQTRHLWPQYRWHHSYSYKKMNGTGMGTHTQNMGHKERFPPRSCSKLPRCPRQNMVLSTQERPHRLPQHNPHPNPPTSRHTMVSSWRPRQEKITLGILHRVGQQDLSQLNPNLRHIWY